MILDHSHHRSVWNVCKAFHFTYFSVFLLIFYPGSWTLEETVEFSPSTTDSAMPTVMLFS